MAVDVRCGILGGGRSSWALLLLAMGGGGRVAIGYNLQPGHYSNLTAPNLNPQQTKNETTNVVINIIVASS